MNAKDEPKILEIEALNCDSYTVKLSLDEKSYVGNASSSRAEISIEDIPTEEKSVVIKLTAIGMKDFTKSLKVKKDAQNTQPKEFDVTKIKLWGHDIKEANSVVVNAKDEPKTLEVEVSNCDDYVVSLRLGEKNYTGNASSGRASIEIADIPTEEKPFVIKFTALGMREFSKSLKVKKNVENIEPKEFDVTRIRLWGHNIKEENSVVVNAKDEPRILEIGVQNCNDYVVSVKLGEKNYTGNASSGKVSIEIADIPTEEKSLVIMLSAQSMKNFSKSLKVKKSTENIQLEEFNVTKIRLWGHDIKTETSLIVNGKDIPKTLEIEVANCADYKVDAMLGEQTYIGDSVSSKVSIEIADIPKEEVVFSIKFSASGKKDWTKKLNVKKVDIDFSLHELNLWGHDIRNKGELKVLITDEPKILEVMVSNCDDYLVSVSLNGEEYKGNASSGNVELPIKGIPLEEKELTIKLSALGMNDFVKSIKVQRVKSNFEISTLKLWGHDIMDKNVLTVYSSDVSKTLQVRATNCDEYLATVSLDGKEYTGNATSGIVMIPIKDIPLERKRLTIKLSSPDMNDFNKVIVVKREFTDAPDLKVFFKSEDDNIEKGVGKDGNPLFSTTQDIGEVIIRTKDSVMKSVSVNGKNAVLSQDKKNATYNLDTSHYVRVSVEVEFEDFKKATRTFGVKKYANQSELPLYCIEAKIVSGDDVITSLDFDSNNKASVELGNIQYSCIKLVMNMSKPLTSATLEECKDDRSVNYSINPNESDLKGIFSGRLIKELDNQGKVTATYTSINEEIYTEHLIVGFGTVEYKFKFTANDGKVADYIVKITNKTEDKVPYSGRNAKFYISQGYGSSFLIGGQSSWRWMTYSPLPINSQEAFQKIADLEYMGDRVKMLFAKLNDGVPGDMYFYYNVFDDPTSKKHEFVRVKGFSNGYASFVRPSFDPEGKYVDAFVAFKDFLPQALLPLQTKKKWSKIVDKGFLFQIENNLRYGQGGDEQTSLDIFYDAFNYRVQAKTYQKGEVLNMGLEQDYAYILDGSVKTIKDKPFLDGGKRLLKDSTDKYAPNDLMIMLPTFTGKIGDSIESIKYTIKKNGVAEADWTDVSLTPSKWNAWLCLNTKDDNIENGKLKSLERMYIFEKETSGTKNIYEIEVKIKPKDSEEEKFLYKINYREKETIHSMSLSNKPNEDTNLFGIPTSYAEIPNRRAYSLIKEAMGQEFLRERLINR